MNTQDFITSIITEKDGFQLDEAWRVNEESLGVVVPVKREVKEERDYITFAEARDVKVEDTGSIDSVYVKNNEDKPLLISRGEIFRGKTQERAAIHGHIIMAGKGMRVSVRCIHRSKGISKGADMTYGGKVPSAVFNNLNDQGATWRSVDVHNTCYYNSTVSPKMKSHTTSDGVRHPGPVLRSRGIDDGDSNITLDSFTLTSMDNGSNWDDRLQWQGSNGTSRGGSIGVNGSPIVGEGSSEIITPTASFTAPFHMFNDRVGSSIGSSDDMVGSLDDITQKIKEAMKKIPPIENQVGAIFIFENEFQGMDVYNLPDSWRAVKDETIAKEGSSFMKKDDTSIFEFKPERVKGLIGKELGGKFEEKVIYGELQGQDYKIIEIREIVEEKSKKRIIGEAVEFKGKIIHLTLSRV